MDTTDSPDTPVHEVILSEEEDNSSPQQHQALRAQGQQIQPQIDLQHMTPQQIATHYQGLPEQQQIQYRAAFEQQLQLAQQRMAAAQQANGGAGVVEGVETIQPTVEDTEAFMAKHLPDLGEQIEATSFCRWELTNFSNLPKRLQGPRFECGKGHQWSILIFPSGNSSGQPPNEMVSIYLEHSSPSEDFSACAQFALALANPNDPSVFTVSHAHHRFVPQELDWGFTRFSDVRKLMMPADGKRPIIENDSVIVYAFVRKLVDPLGVLWHNFIDYDSRKVTGHTGLKNQAATCYLNSTLQAIFHTPSLRRAVYQVPTQEDTPNSSLVLALQRLFYNLQTSPTPVGTKELTTSFGWTAADAFTQHDCQEFLRILLDRLETRTKGTAADGAVEYALKGQMRSFIRCLDIDYESSRVEDFYDVQLSVQGMAGLEDSLKDYISTETLDGDNKYAVEGRGLHVAEKGTTLFKLPPVLHMQLRRFTYSFENDSMAKINDRFEFPPEIDMKPYLDDSSPQKTEDMTYVLHGVLVHSGSLEGGHYYALLRPGVEDKWFRFDDDRVIPALPREVFEENFGGPIMTNGNLPRNRQQQGVRKSFTSAYMLIYVQKNAQPEIFKPVQNVDVPKYLVDKIEEEKRLMEERRREREESHLYLRVQLISDETFEKHDGFDVAAFDGTANLPTYRVLKTETYQQFRHRLAEQYKVEDHQVTCYIIVSRQNKTARPDTALGEAELGQTLDAIRTSMTARSQDLRLYLEINPDLKPTSPHPDPSTCVLFLKYFDRKAQSLTGRGHVHVNKDAKIGDLVPAICERMGWPSSTPLKIYEEIKPQMIEAVKLKATITASELQDGDILAFETEFQDKDINEYEAQGQYGTVLQYYDFLANKTIVRFRPKDGHVTDENPEFDLALSRKLTYDGMSEKVGARLNYDAAKLRFSNKTIIRRQLNQSVAELTGTGYGYHPPAANQQPPVLYYEKLNTSLSELETKRSLTVVWTGLHNKAESTHALLLPKTTTYDGLSEALTKLVKLSETGSGRIRTFEITSDGRMQKEFNPSEMLGSLRDGAEIFAEEIPMDELNVSDQDRVVQVCHFHRDISQTHSVPFRLVITAGERFADTKERIRQRLQPNEKEWSRWRFFLAQSQLYKTPTALNDDDVLAEHAWKQSDVLAIDHVDKTKKPPSQDNRAITIR